MTAEKKKAKKIVLIIILVFVIPVVLMLFVTALDIFITRSPELELIDMQYTGKQKRATNVFIIKDKDSYFVGAESWYDIKYYLPDYDVSLFDTDNYTYIVAVDYEIEKLSYNGKYSRYRNIWGNSDFYYALIDGRKTNDGNLRIYRMKKMDKLEMHDSDPDYTNENYRKNEVVDFFHGIG